MKKMKVKKEWVGSWHPIFKTLETKETVVEIIDDKEVKKVIDKVYDVPEKYEKEIMWQGNSKAKKSEVSFE